MARSSEAVTARPAEAFRLTGPSERVYTINIEIDAARSAGTGKPIAVLSGVAPTLAALEIAALSKECDSDRQCRDGRGRAARDHSGRRR